MPEPSKPLIERNADPPPAPDWQALLAISVGAIITTALVMRAPFLGHDWIMYFSTESILVEYPPWIWVILKPLILLPARTGLGVLNGLALSAVSMLAYRYGRHTFPQAYSTAIWAVIFVLVTPIPWMLLWLGQIEVVALLGVVTIPFGVPLLFAKPNIALWAALRSRWGIAAIVITLGLSLVLWPGWLGPFVNSVSSHRAPDFRSLGWAKIGWPLGALGGFLLLFTDRDPMRLMAAGSFAAPFMMPYHYYLLLPAMGRVGGYRQLALWISSLFMVFTIGLPDLIGIKLLALTFPLLVWALTGKSLKPREVLADPDIMLNRALRFLRAGWEHIHPAAALEEMP